MSGYPERGFKLTTSTRGGALNHYTIEQNLFNCLKYFIIYDSSHAQHDC